MKLFSFPTTARLCLAIGLFCGFAAIGADLSAEKHPGFICETKIVDKEGTSITRLELKKNAVDKNSFKLLYTPTQYISYHSKPGESIPEQTRQLGSDEQIVEIRDNPLVLSLRPNHGKTAGQFYHALELSKVTTETASMNLPVQTYFHARVVPYLIDLHGNANLLKGSAEFTLKFHPSDCK